MMSRSLWYQKERKGGVLLDLAPEGDAQTDEQVHIAEFLAHDGVELSPRMLRQSSLWSKKCWKESRT
jgi:hypothetical protein